MEPVVRNAPHLRLVTANPAELLPEARVTDPDAEHMARVCRLANRLMFHANADLQRAVCAVLEPLLLGV